MFRKNCLHILWFQVGELFTPDHRTLGSCLVQLVRCLLMYLSTQNQHTKPTSINIPSTQIATFDDQKFLFSEVPQYSLLSKWLLQSFRSFISVLGIYELSSHLCDRSFFPGARLGRPILGSLLGLPHDGGLHKDFRSWDKGQDTNWALFYLRMTLPSPSWFSGYLDWFELLWYLIWAIGIIYVDPIKLQGGIYFIYFICWSKTFQVTANSIFCIILLESWNTVHF